MVFGAKEKKKWKKIYKVRISWKLLGDVLSDVYGWYKIYKFDRNQPNGF